MFSGRATFNFTVITFSPSLKKSVVYKTHKGLKKIPLTAAVQMNYYKYVNIKS